VTDRPLVSIVTPTLNQGAFIEATINSIRAQTYGQFEHIVVDGGSTDGTLDILRRHEGAYAMRWLSEPDRGMYDAVNKGMRLATGEILGYLNSDDLYFPWTLETVVEAFLRNPRADVVFGDAYGVSDGSRADIRFQPSHRYGYLLHSSSFVQPAVFWRRRVAEAVGEFDADMRLAGDLDYWLRMGPHRAFARVDEVLAIERDHGTTQRSRQWDLLMTESARARARAGAGTAGQRRVGLVVERFRAWLSRRVLWARFALATTGAADRRRGWWQRFRGAQSIDFAFARSLAAQLPWLGRRVAPGTLTSSVDWIARFERGVAAQGDVSPSSDQPVTRGLVRQRREWGELATIDPLWAILSDPSKEGGRWELDEFFETGRVEVDQLMSDASRLGYPAARNTALDFGCGVGRITQALGSRFDEAIGVDIAQPMVDRARELAKDVPNCTFRTNAAEDLGQFGDAAFDLVYSKLVLQHVGSSAQIGQYLSELARVLAPSGLGVVQVPAAIPFRYRLQPRRRLYRALRLLRIPANVLQQRFKLYPISMDALPEKAVHEVIGSCGGTVLRVDRTVTPGFGIRSVTYWFTR
jgi:SAM-dependent methyltransferase